MGLNSCVRGIHLRLSLECGHDTLALVILIALIIVIKTEPISLEGSSNHTRMINREAVVRLRIRLKCVSHAPLIHFTCTKNTINTKNTCAWHECRIHFTNSYNACPEHLTPMYLNAHDIHQTLVLHMNCERAFLTLDHAHYLHSMHLTHTARVLHVHSVCTLHFCCAIRKNTT